MLAALERICQTQALPYELKEDTLSVFAASEYPATTHSFSLGMTQGGDVGVFAELPPCAQKEIRDVAQFCEKLGERLGSGASVGFNDEAGVFFLYHVVALEELAAFLKVLAADCDFIKPLCESVGREGNWHCAFYLAFASPKDVKRWPRA